MGLNVVTEVQNGLRAYNAQVPVIVASNGFESSVKEYQQKMMARQIPLQLIDANLLIKRAQKLPDITTNKRKPRPYQEDAIKEIVGAFYSPTTNRALAVMATGLGKTFVASESIRRISENIKVKVLVCAHTNDLVYQLERAFWPFIKPSDSTLVWNSYERPTQDQLENTDFTFACVDSVAGWVKNGRNIPDYDILIVDECHHVGSSMYDAVFAALSAGQPGGSFASIS